MSHESVTCLLLIRCGQNLKGVAGVDLEGPLREKSAKALFEETTEFLK